MSVQQEEDDESPRCVAEYDEVEDDEGVSLSSATSSHRRNHLTSSSGHRQLRQLVVDLKMELAEALAQVEDLTLANRRLEQERDRAREHIRWLRTNNPTTENSRPAAADNNDFTPINNRRASDGGASFVREMLPSSISSLQDETTHPSPTPPTTTAHRASTRPNTFDDGDDYEEEDEHIETLHITEHGHPILSTRDVGSRTTLTTIPTGLHASLRSSLRRLSNEICSTLQPLSSETASEISSEGTRSAHTATGEPFRHNETDRAAGLPTLSRNTQETFHDYTTQIIFGKDGTADAYRQQRRDRRQRKSLVSNLQIAQARIAASSEEDAEVDISPYLFSEDED